MTKTLKDAASVAISEPDRVSRLFTSLTKIEGAAINLRGALLELIVGHLVYKGEGGTGVDIGVRVQDDRGEKAEIDVRIVKGDHSVHLYECKARQSHSEITEEEIEKWLKERIPIIRRALMTETRFRQSRMVFEYWTTGVFSEAALNVLKQAKSNINRYGIAWKDGAEIAAYARHINAKSMTDVLTEHYLKHPLSN